MTNDSTIDSSFIYLQEGRFGAPDLRLGVPKDGFLGTEHHNVSAAKYPARTVVRVYCDGTAQNTDGEAGGELGYAEFTYLKAAADNISCAAKTMCLQESLGDWTTVSPDASTVLHKTGRGLMGAVAISAVTNSYYGWFWTGGVVPIGYVSALSGNYKTDSTVDEGAMMIQTLSALESLGFSLAASLGEVFAGYSCSADA